jgi:hypothetical protein
MAQCRSFAFSLILLLALACGVAQTVTDEAGITFTTVDVP